jgi:hypothetical protein
LVRSQAPQGTAGTWSERLRAAGWNGNGDPVSPPNATLTIDSGADFL